MVLIIRGGEEEEAVKVFAKPGGKVFQDQVEGKAEYDAGKAEIVKWVDIVIVSKYDIGSCYQHHVQGQFYRNRPDEEYTVIQRTSKRKVSPEEFMNDIKYYLLVIELKEGEVDFFLPEKFYLAFTYKQGKNITPTAPRKAKIHFRGIRKIKQEDFLAFAQLIVLNEKEVEEVESYLKNAFKKDSGYRLRNIWIVEHTDARAC